MYARIIFEDLREVAAAKYILFYLRYFKSSVRINTLFRYILDIRSRKRHHVYFDVYFLFPLKLHCF